MKAKFILQRLYAEFPALDPTSEDYDTGVNAADVIDWLTDHEAEIQEAIRETKPINAVILEGGLVQCIISTHPEQIPGEFIIIDYDTDYGDETEFSEIPQPDRSNSLAYIRGEAVTLAGIDLPAVSNILDAKE